MSWFNKADFERDLTFYALAALWISMLFSKALVEIFFTASFLLWIFWLVRKKINPFEKFPKSFQIPLLIFMAISAASIFWSEYPKNSVRGIEKLLKVVL